MKKIAIESATAGTRLARPVTNDSGITLFGEGTILDERSIERIKGLGVDYIYVEGASSPRRPVEEELADLERRFSKVIDVPYMTTIKTAVKEYIFSLYEDERKTDQG
ncbi:MAG: hypothetical protein ACK415_10515 [Thermodesulfovibrionales bacterium]